MHSVTDTAAAVNTLPSLTAGHDGYIIRQGQRAREFAPPEKVSREEFMYRASFYDLPTLRLASMRYIAARGRSYETVLSRFADAVANPHVNRGDDYRLALGHIEATRRQEMAREGGAA